MSRRNRRLSRRLGRASLGLALAGMLTACGAASEGAAHQKHARREGSGSRATRVTRVTQHGRRSNGALRTSAPARAAASRTPRTARAARPSAPAPAAKLLAAATASQVGGFAPAVALGDQVAAWVSRTAAGVTLLAFDQRLVELHLHSGTVDAGASGWRFGPEVAGAELRELVAGFNGGFRLDTDAGGFESYGRTAVPLRAGLGSVVTYADGYTDVGSWQQEVPGRGHGRVVSVRQNLALLIDHGRPAASIGCISCWGATLGGVAAPARSGLGITADGRLVWAGGEQLTPAQLAQAMLSAGVVRAVQLDINPEWVAAYLYRHTGAAMPTAIEMVAGAPGIPGQLLSPYSRDFFTVVAR